MRKLSGFALAAVLSLVLSPVVTFAQETAPPAPTPPVPAPAPAPADAPKKVTRPTVTIATEKGKIVIELYPEDAPLTVANFESLIKKGFYNNLNFHRVIKDFVIQGGDPKGDGTGGPGYMIKNEPNKILKHTRGAVAMANAGRDTAGSQFYIVIGKPAPHLDNGDYTIFGKVVSGQDVAEKIAVGDVMTSVTLVEPETPVTPATPPAPPKVTKAAEPVTIVPVTIPYLEKPAVPKSTKPKVKVSIDADGKVVQVDIKEKTGVAEMDKALREALSKWAWSPALKNGVAVKSDRTFVYDLLNGSRRYE